MISFISIVRYVNYLWPVKEIVSLKNIYPRTKIFSDCVENFCPTLKIFVHLAKSCLPDFSSALHVSYCIVAH